jgi:hypothetical protein
MYRLPGVLFLNLLDGGTRMTSASLQKLACGERFIARLQRQRGFANADLDDAVRAAWPV